MIQAFTPCLDLKKCWVGILILEAIILPHGATNDLDKV
jgi:hypothetical protein